MGHYDFFEFHVVKVFPRALQQQSFDVNHGSKSGRPEQAISVLRLFQVFWKFISQGITLTPYSHVSYNFFQTADIRKHTIEE
jgi:hypothetical protein